MAEHIEVASQLSHICQVRFTSEQMRVLERLADKHGLNIIQLIQKAVLQEMESHDELLAAPSWTRLSRRRGRSRRRDALPGPKAEHEKWRSPGS